jgi:GcrA cell cycle regulator
MAPLNNATATAKLLDMWRAGATGAEIARALGTTRNAVIGKIFRLRNNGVDMARVKVPVVRNLPKLEKTVKLRPKPPSTPKPKVAWPPPLTKEEKEALIAQKKAEVERVQRARGIKFIDLKARDCRFILNGGRPEGYLFCGDPRLAGKPYCQEHSELCYRADSSR